MLRWYSLVIFFDAFSAWYFLCFLDQWWFPTPRGGGEVQGGGGVPGRFWARVGTTFDPQTPVGTRAVPSVKEKNAKRLASVGASATVARQLTAVGG